MSIWTVADILLWIAVAAPCVLLGCGLLLAALLARRSYRALTAASHRLAAFLQESPLADPDPLDDDTGERHDYAADLTAMRRLGQLLDDAPLIPTRPGSDQAALDTCTRIWDTPARTEENQ